jgi:hypothetical protein
MATYTRWVTVARQVAALQAARPGFRAPETVSNDTPVFFGPVYGISGDHAAKWLAIGWAGTPTRVTEAGESGQSTATLGNRGRDERGVIRCRACAQTGDRATTATEDAVDVILASVEDLLRTNPTLGLDQAWMRSAEMGSDMRIQPRFASGFVLEVDFTITYRARI